MIIFMNIVYSERIKKSIQALWVLLTSPGVSMATVTFVLEELAVFLFVFLFKNLKNMGCYCKYANTDSMYQCFFNLLSTWLGVFKNRPLIVLNGIQKQN